MNACFCRGRKRWPPISAGTHANHGQVRAGAWATLWTGVLVAAIVLGSRNLQNFRSGARHVHLCDYLRHLGSHLPLQRLDSQASHAGVLAARMATFQATGGTAQFEQCRHLGGARTFSRKILFAVVRGCAGPCTS